MTRKKAEFVPIGLIVYLCVCVCGDALSRLRCFCVCICMICRCSSVTGRLRRVCCWFWSLLIFVCLQSFECFVCVFPVLVLLCVHLHASVQSFVCFVAFVCIFVSFACSCVLCRQLCDLSESCSGVDGPCVWLSVFPR